MLEEVVVVIDKQEETGRIKKLHSNAAVIPLDPDALQLKLDDSRLRFVDLNLKALNAVSEKWFNVPGVLRCQAGTPIFAFLYGIEICTSPFILRTDCDIFFLDQGFVSKALSLLPDYDLVQPPFLNNDRIPFSTRSFFINRDRISRKLPIKLLRLDLFRQFHRRLHHRPTWMALEQIMDWNIENGKLDLFRCDISLGYTMHVSKRSDFDDIETVIESFLEGNLPEKQLLDQHNYIPGHWHEN